MIPLFSDHAISSGLDLQGAVKRVIDRHWYVLGQEVAAFESEFAEFVGVDHCVSVANGTDALEIALRGLGIGPGDKVVAVANAGFYGSTAIHAIGAVPVYVDVDAASLTMSPDALSAALEHQPKCVIITHLYGQLADATQLMQIARNAGMKVIEDCAQSHGAERDGRQAGGWADASCFSFYPTKNLGALGDGGAILTQDAEIAAKLRVLRQYGWSTKYQVSSQGGRNSRLDGMQAAILREKLPHLAAWNEDRRRIAARYNAAFASLPVTLPVSTGKDFVAHLYVLRVSNRAELQAFLKAEGIASDVHYPIPDYSQPAYPGAIRVGSMPVTEQASACVVSLPCFPGLPEADVDRVISAVTAFYNR